MTKRLAAVVVVLALALGFFLGRESTGARFEWIAAEDRLWRGDRQTGEVVAFVWDRGFIHQYRPYPKPGDKND